ncbi:DUF202 domain-containing protein [Patulibacter sp. SYSU D01012]|uniref:YidH family protein n=1 Tax=Patulibacter sp. SYSU D01012 TaxID=2817381 RepID=UPI001B30E31F
MDRAAEELTPEEEAERERAWSARPLDPRDYSRRTLLANERTYLAWWRTGLTALTAALAAARVVPELTDADVQWPYTALGVGFSIIGLVAIAYGHRRRLEVERAVRRGEFPATSDRVTGLVSLVGLLTGVAMLAIILFET